MKTPEPNGGTEKPSKYHRLNRRRRLRFVALRTALALTALALLAAAVGIGALFYVDWHMFMARRDAVPVHPRAELYRELAPKALDFADAVCSRGGYSRVRDQVAASYRRFYSPGYHDYMRSHYTQLTERELRGESLSGRFVPMCEVLDELEVQTIQRLNHRLAAVTLRARERGAGAPVFQVLFERVGREWFPAYSRVEAVLVNLGFEFVLPR